MIWRRFETRFLKWARSPGTDAERTWFPVLAPRVALAAADRSAAGPGSWQYVRRFTLSISARAIVRVRSRSERQRQTCSCTPRRHVTSVRYLLYVTRQALFPSRPLRCRECQRPRSYLVSRRALRPRSSAGGLAVLIWGGSHVRSMSLRHQLHRVIADTCPHAESAHPGKCQGCMGCGDTVGDDLLGSPGLDLSRQQSSTLRARPCWSWR